MAVLDTIHSGPLLASTEDLSRHYNQVAEYYDALLWPLEVIRLGGLRSFVCGNLSGSILEAGVGTGLNLPHFPGDCQVTGVDVSEGMLAQAGRKADPARVKLLKMDACHLDFPDRRFDACLAAFLLGVLDEDSRLRAVNEMLRVTRPGGIVRLVDWQYPLSLPKRLAMMAGAPLMRAVLRTSLDFNMQETVALSGATVLWQGSMRGETAKVFDLVAPDKPKGGR